MNRNLRIAALLVLGLSLSAQAPSLSQGTAQPITSALKDDPDMVKVLEPLAADMKAQFGRVLAECPQGLTRGMPGEENMLGYWVADLMRERAQQYVDLPVHFAFTNKGGLRANLPKGQVKVSDVFQLMPFDNELVIAEYTGAEIMQIVKEGIQTRGGEPCSGVKISVAGTAEKPVYTVTWSDGSAINPTETFRAALTDYLLASGDRIPTFKVGRKAVLTGLTLRSVLLEACMKLGQAKTPLTAPAAGRYTFTPEIYQAIQAHTLAK